MKSAVKKDQNKASITTIVGSIILLITIVWASFSFILVQFGQPRTEIPHEEYTLIPDWPYNIENWTGGRSSWFDNVNYTDIPMNLPPPTDINDSLDNVVFYVVPENPPQLWRRGAYDAYDGSSWGKSIAGSERPLASTELITQTQAQQLGNQIYTIILNLTAGPNVGAIELPVLFPQTLLVEGSFQTGSVVNGQYQVDANSRLTSYELTTDVYGTVLFRPLIGEETGRHVLVSYEVTYANQDLNNVATQALTGDNAPPEIRSMYGQQALAGVDLTPNVEGNISQFIGVGSNAYETAQAVSLHFQTTYNLILNEPDVFVRPGLTEEVTDWFLARGGGLPMDFATAYCVFMRYLDIPARLAIGYAVGDAEGGFRTVRVRHMMFWAEVYVPMSGPAAGEWIQVLPLPLPPDMGGGEVPENVGQGDVQLIIFNSRWAQGWVEIGQEFQIYGAILFSGTLITSPELITFYDQTASQIIGSATINSTGLATLDYTFPALASPGMHNITGTYIAPSFQLINFTLIYAVATPSPRSPSGAQTGGFELSGTVDVDIKVGLDNYTAFWLDTLHVHGVMTVGGVPVDGSTLTNRWMQIMWDELSYGDAEIQSDGTYQYDIPVTPTDSRMTLGSHQLWASYGGEYDQGIPILLPARSQDNSTVAVWGKVSVGLSLSPEVVHRGDILLYQGVAQLLDGTPLADESIGLFFDGIQFTTTTSNSSGGFSGQYTIPSDATFGMHYARANWSTTLSLVLGNWSQVVEVEIESSGADLTMSSSPQSPQTVHPLETITIYGYLTDNINASGLVGKPVDIYWNNGTYLTNIATVTTVAGGYYEYNYVVPLGDLGPVSYWCNYTSYDPNYEGAVSENRSIIVEAWPTQISVFTDRTYYHLNQTVTMWGQLVLQYNGSPLAFRDITIYWYNETSPSVPYHVFTTQTDATGWYYYAYPLTTADGPTVVNHVVEFLSESSAMLYADCTNNTLLTLQLYQFDLIVVTDSTEYHLDEVIQISGSLAFLENGAPLAGATVVIHYLDSADNHYQWSRVTDSNGLFTLYYNLSLTDVLGPIEVWASYLSTDPDLWADTVSTNQTATLILYRLALILGTDSTSYHLNETVLIGGQLTFQNNGTPIQNQQVVIYWLWDNGTVMTLVPAPTDINGLFVYYYTCSPSKDYASIVALWAQFPGNLVNPLWDNGTSPGVSISLVLYPLDLQASAPPSVYLDQSLPIQGQLTHLGGSPPLGGATVLIYILNGMAWTQVGSNITDAAGYFIYYYHFTVGTQGPGDYWFMCGYNSTDPLVESKESTPFVVAAQKYPVILDLWLSSNSVMQNESVTIYFRLSFQNGTGIAGRPITILWQNSSLYSIATGLLTDSLGEGDFTYYALRGHTDVTGIIIYATFSGTALLNSNTSNLEPLTLLQWQTAFTAFSTGGVTSIYISETLTVTGVLEYDLGGSYVPFGDAQVSIVFDGNVIGTPTTDSGGQFVFVFDIPSVSPGTYTIFAAFTPSVNWINGSESYTIELDISAYVIVWSSLVAPPFVYRGDTLAVSGIASLDNGSPLVGCTVQLIWGGIVRATNTTQGDGSFLLQYSVPWGYALGPLSPHVELVPPSSYYTNLASSEQSTSVRDLVSVTLDSQTVTIVRRQDTLVVSGLVENGNGGSQGASVLVTVDGSPTPYGMTTGVDGRFNIGLLIQAGWVPGEHDVGVIIASSYHDVSSYPTAWTVEYHASSSVTITWTGSPTDVMRGESFVVSVGLEDEDGNALSGYLDLYLGDTLVYSQYAINSGTVVPVTLTVPGTWGAGNGYFSVRAVYAGTTYVDANEAELVDTLHVFIDAVFTSDILVESGDPLVVSGSIRDGAGNPIRLRDLAIGFNGSIVNVLTNANGHFTVEVLSTTSVGTYTYSITILSSSTSDMFVDEYTIQVQAGANMQDLLNILIPSAFVAVAIIMVLYYIYRRGVFRRSLKVTPTDTPGRLRNIKKLADGGKYGAAITLAYRTFEQMCGSRIGTERLASETAREYMDRILKSLSLDSALVEEFVHSYEEARFSQHEISREKYESAMKTFTDLYPRVDTASLTTE